MLRLDDAGLIRGGRTLLENASLRLHRGERVGLIGANGAGKSSLFALLRGQLNADSGAVDVPQSW